VQRPEEFIAYRGNVNAYLSMFGRLFGKAPAKGVNNAWGCKWQ
jgi:hypothetical protein